MKKITALIFPDSSVQHPEFLSSSYLFFDELLGPPVQKPLKEETFRSMIKMVPDGDIQTAQKEFIAANDVISRYGEITRLGLVTPIDEKEANKNPYFENRLSFFDQIIRTNSDVKTLLAKAEAEVSAWTEDSPGVGQARDPDSDAYFKAVEYALRSIQRIDWAKSRESSLVVDSLQQYSALKSINVLAYQRPSAHVFTLVREFFKLSVPHLVAKSYEDILELGEKLKEYIEPFRVEMRRLHTFIPTDCRLDEAVSEMNRLVLRDVAPKMHELEKYLKSGDQNLLKHLLNSGKTFSTAATTFIGYTMATIAPESVQEILKVSALSFPPALFLFGAQMNTEFEKIRVKMENPFTFAVLSQNRFKNEK